ncbi:hypothetical protein K9N08_04100 [Candidatus Gracilibacteria bacterium]|nr:hypothetical protein [Candidatus Gracilibacteria bacterium]MCF7856697.1 hypothetical protein [Candidatus Gracilibacteria bacterium]MCF7896977.1 hypothetical protein [Candidatus Gracilibacteria bacterium]
MPQNKIVATVEKIARSKIWLTADSREFYLPVELWPNARIGEKIEVCPEDKQMPNDLQRMLEEIIN